MANDKDSHIRPFSGYVWKIHSRCNLNCSYCYMYNLADSSWQRQPKKMSIETAQRAVERIRDHCVRHQVSRISITLHGGEPLLVGAQHLQNLITTINQTLHAAGISSCMTLQSNGLLFSPEIGDVLRAEGVSLGISIDGPPEINDKFRRDHLGRPSSLLLEDRLRLITRAYSDVFAGFLCVIDPEAPPVETMKYLESFRPPTINFLLPLDNYDRRPAGKEHDLTNTVYGDWLSTVFDYWTTSPHRSRILVFNSIINLLFGRAPFTESHGLAPVDLIVIETNGDIEAVDSLKSTYEDAANTGLNVFDNDLDDAAYHLAILSRRLGLAGLCATCQDCPLVSVCGGGDFPTRYSSERGFNNPSIYCTDLQSIITHINRSLLQAAG